ncbi:MAG: hypothetical protein ACJA1Y_001153 [Burkholderiaceae bacterium]
MTSTPTATVFIKNCLTFWTTFQLTDKTTQLRSRCLIEGLVCV